MAEKVRTSHCFVCTGIAYSTEYVPPKGIDPLFREFKCSDCGSIFFTATRVEPLKPSTDFFVDSPGPLGNYFDLLGRRYHLLNKP